jgi:hypothetical protein
MSIVIYVCFLQFLSLLNFICFGASKGNAKLYTDLFNLIPKLISDLNL